MEQFLSIDWHPPINDIIDSEFVDVDRLEKSSAMYRILHGTFTDPSKNIHEDFYSFVTEDSIQCIKKQSSEKAKLMKQTKKAAQSIASAVKAKAAASQDMSHKLAEARMYVPGIVKTHVRFPRASYLTIEQQALCVKIFKLFSTSDKPDISAINKDELAMYMNLQTKIKEEQEEFLTIAKENWDPSAIRIDCENLINRKWKSKFEYALNFHRYYTEVGTIPFVCEHEIKYHFDTTLQNVKNLPKFLLPDITKYRYKFTSHTNIVAKKYFRSSKLDIENQISRDENCKKFSESTDVDLVISSSGLHCLASNVESTYSQMWTLPVEIREINGKNVAFIDKPLLPKAKDALQKNNWIYKYILKTFLVKPSENFIPKRPLVKYEDFDKPNDNSDESVEDVDDNHMNNDNVNNMEDQTINHYQYNVFKIGACGLLQNELMKKKIDKDFKILVRSKIDAVEHLGNGETAWVKIAPKLENQMGLGAEAVTLEEAARQWVSLAFTPDTALVRVRVYQQTGEFIQCERRSPMSINNELTRLYNIRGEDILGFIYNITEQLTKLTPGNYILRHTSRNGAFASICKAADSSSHQAVDLHTVYCDAEFRTIPNPPWPLIDKTLLTPALICFNRMPAMFYPARYVKKDHSANAKSANKKRKK